MCASFTSVLHIKKKEIWVRLAGGKITGVKIKIESFVTFMLTFILAVCQKTGTSEDIPKEWLFNYPTVILLSHESFWQSKSKKLKKCIYNLCSFSSLMHVLFPYWNNKYWHHNRMIIEWFTNELKELKAETWSRRKGCLWWMRQQQWLESRSGTKHTQVFWVFVSTHSFLPLGQWFQWDSNHFPRSLERPGCGMASGRASRHPTAPADGVSAVRELLCMHTEFCTSRRCCSCHTSSAHPPCTPMQISCLGRGWSRARRIKEMGVPQCCLCAPRTAGAFLLLRTAELSRGRAGTGLYCTGCRDLLGVLWHHKD